MIIQFVLASPSVVVVVRSAKRNSLRCRIIAVTVTGGKIIEICADNVTVVVLSARPQSVFYPHDNGIR